VQPFIIGIGPFQTFKTFQSFHRFAPFKSFQNKVRSNVQGQVRRETSTFREHYCQSMQRITGRTAQEYYDRRDTSSPLKRLT
jgi:hypothetical protein